MSLGESIHKTVDERKGSYWWTMATRVGRSWPTIGFCDWDFGHDDVTIHNIFNFRYIARNVTSNMWLKDKYPSKRKCLSCVCFCRRVDIFSRTKPTLFRTPWKSPTVAKSESSWPWQRFCFANPFLQIADSYPPSGDAVKTDRRLAH